MPLWDAANNDNSGGPAVTGPPYVRSPEDWAACQAYVVKYRAKFGVNPPDIWCIGQPQPPASSPVPIPVSPPSVVVSGPDLVVAPVQGPTPSPTTGPMIQTWGWRRRRPPVRRPYIEKPRPVHAVPVEICPIRGYTSRPIPGADEYQNFRCTPGQPVVIDAGLQRAGAYDAYQRHGMAGLDDTQATFAGLFHEVLLGNLTIPPWVPLVALAAGAVFLWSVKKR